MAGWLAWLAAIFELSGIWVIGNRHRSGFLLLLFANILWVIVALSTGIYGLLAVVVVAGVLNVRNWRKWRTTEVKGKGFFSWLFRTDVDEVEDIMDEVRAASKQMKAPPPFDISGQCPKCGQCWHDALLIYCNVPDEHLTVKCVCGYERVMQCKGPSGSVSKM